MTRINVGVDPSELNTKMLIAEHREIKRIPNVIKSGRYSLTNQPKKFTLGTGHVKFFYYAWGFRGITLAYFGTWFCASY